MAASKKRKKGEGGPRNANRVMRDRMWDEVGVEYLAVNQLAYFDDYAEVSIIAGNASTKFGILDYNSPVEWLDRATAIRYLRQLESSDHVSVDGDDFRVSIWRAESGACVILLEFQH
ncbi:hypothetical protein Pmi06nite_78230 [Planotetraspora mira]|uniref:Uncharacterized protein n=1 Tax=Planotetraspora mira TaxID=58121 RepID=A0A8J3TYU1_9ACTN|nr:hypothetical protein Pmi06nite_78230 [Planotetraspora mira]